MIVAIAVIGLAAAVGLGALCWQYKHIAGEITRLSLEIKVAAESIKDAGVRLDDRFSADVSELLNYNYLK
jgi:hypothetical protein